MVVVKILLGRNFRGGKTACLSDIHSEWSAKVCRLPVVTMNTDGAVTRGIMCDRCPHEAPLQSHQPLLILETIKHRSAIGRLNNRSPGSASASVSASRSTEEKRSL